MRMDTALSRSPRSLMLRANACSASLTCPICACQALTREPMADSAGVRSAHHMPLSPARMLGRAAAPLLQVHAPVC